MLARQATRTLRLPLSKPPLPRPTPPCRSLATVSRAARPTQVLWKVVGLLGGAALAYTAWQVKPEWVPMQQPLHADAPAPVGIYTDPTTSTPFPSRLTSPDGTQLRLVGTGVRTVSFLNIKVYAVGFYVSEQELQWAKDGKIAGWEGFTPERLIPPFGIPSGEPDRPKGELLMESLLEKADAAIVIIPLRNTSLPHLRDGFTRAITARMQVPRVSNEFTDNMSERTGAALVEFKSFFPSKTLQKGLPLEVYYSARDRTALFQIRNEQSRKPEVLGTLREPLLARELIVSYFSDTAAPSRELVTSSAMGFSGEARGEPGDRGAA
ncbi:Altered inheritance of mitochondria protein 18, mitochondrial [Rhodotorula toruloides]|nr:Altered inheritance of mitochondria protein 18, mitochondrial [Rhodotorula toruloides]